MSSDDFEFLSPGEKKPIEQPIGDDHAAKLQQVGKLFTTEELGHLIKLGNDPSLKSMAISFMKNK